MDVFFINPDSSAKAYQGLAQVFSAIEPPTWALLLAESCRAKGFEPGILDCDAEKLSLNQAVTRIGQAAPRIAVFVLYGQNPNSGTTSMIGACALARALKDSNPEIPVCFVGSHVSALPREVLRLPFVDIVLLNEGVYALLNLLKSNLDDDLAQIRGIGYKRTDPSGEVVLSINIPERVVPQDRMDDDLPGYAWDLLPFRHKPLDLYRSHFWHAGFDHDQRTPFAAIYTSLGCQFACDFCMINIVNRTDNADGVSAADSRVMRFWTTEWVMRQLRKLADLSVKTVRISDEMFFLNRKYYVPMLEAIVQEEMKFKMWTYSRVDTVRSDQLALFKSAGIDWLALGVEAGNQVVRKEVSKGTFKEVNIREVCRSVSDAGIHVISNYIFGLPHDTRTTMQETLDLALELNTEMANMYPCQALPGSPIHVQAQKRGWALPDSYEGYAFLSYESQPLPTLSLSAAEVLEFRDQAWQSYFTRPDYLSLVQQKFGDVPRANVEAMTKIPLKRKLLGHAAPE
jgi:anaerobic magnesium-protoporphyrin IX monomethyl ester cyclase